MKKINRVWPKERIIALLDRNDLAVERGILCIQSRQTEYERLIKKTKESNGVGWNSHHAQLGHYLASWIKAGNHLSGKWLAKGRKLIKHYWKQLMKVANNEEV